MSAIQIAGRTIGEDAPVFIIAEMSANHDRDLNHALTLLDIAAEAGVDAVKLQTYTADSLTLPTSHSSARVDPAWGADTLYELYSRAAMPMEFHHPLFERAANLGMVIFSSVFDERGVDFLESLDVPAYKVASPELVHIPLLRHIAKTGKPVILSTGMANLGEVEEALDALAAPSSGASSVVLLHCSSAYPASPSSVNLTAMETLRQAFRCPVGLSDHTLGTHIAIAAAALGACIVEKHFTSDTRRSGPDHRFSLGPDGLREMVRGIRDVTAAKGTGRKHVMPEEEVNRVKARRSVFAGTNIPAGTQITADMLRIVRPGVGLHPRWVQTVVGRKARRDLSAGDPINWDDI